jgi:hypothetical protein
MKMFLALLFSIFVTTNCQAQERVTTEKLDPATTKKKVNDAINHYRMIKKLGSEFTYVKKRFPNKAEIHMFYTPSLLGSLHTIVINDKSELVLERETTMFQDNPTFDYKSYADSVIICYQWRTVREVGPGLSRRGFERRVELYEQKQITTLKIEGDVEHHSYGQKDAAWSFYFDQNNKCSLSRNEVALNYKFKLWEQTGDYQSEDFLTKVKPDNSNEFTIYMDIKRGDLIVNEKKSQSLPQTPYGKSSFTKEIMKY